MSHNTYFQFKQFKINQQYTAMKVNTDGVLLGAWANFENTRTVLDVGTGTGLIALMAAQRCDAIISGIEIEKFAAGEAAENVQLSPWSNRISIQNISFQEYVEKAQTQFDIIVTNPPFFTNSIKNSNPHLSMARHNHLLPFIDIISGAKKLLANKGVLALILPADEAPGFIEKAEKNGFILNRISKVIPYQGKGPNRFLMEFGFVKQAQISDSIFVFDETHKNYSPEFIALTREFYLKH